MSASHQKKPNKFPNNFKILLQHCAIIPKTKSRIANVYVALPLGSWQNFTLFSDMRSNNLVDNSIFLYMKQKAYEMGAILRLNDFVFSSIMSSRLGKTQICSEQIKFCLN